jgi:hypothetical protein
MTPAGQPVSQSPVARRKRDDQPAAGAALAPGDGPSRDDGARAPCPVCGRAYPVSGRARYCSDRCRKKAWRRRRTPAAAPASLPAGIARRPVTVYECAACGTRRVGEQRCDSCGTFMVRVGWGGPCPHCDAPVAIEDLLDVSALSPGPTMAPQHTKSRGATTTIKGGRA